MASVVIMDCKPWRTIIKKKKRTTITITLLYKFRIDNTFLESHGLRLNIIQGISIQRSLDGGPSAPKAPVPGPLLNIKGITVQRVDEQGGQRSGPVTPNLNPHQQQIKQRAEAQRAQQTAAQMRQQEQAINRWANGCEHGCRICRKNGKNFTSFTKQGLLKHLEAEHEVSGKSGGFSGKSNSTIHTCTL